MKIYQSEKTGSLYFLANYASTPGNGADLMQAPMNSSDGLIDLDKAAVVDWDFVATEPSDDPESLYNYLQNVVEQLKA